VSNALRRFNVLFRKNTIIDPKKVLKDAKAFGTVDTLVSNEVIQDLM